MKHHPRLAVVVAMTLSLVGAGCGLMIDRSVSQYHEAAPRVHLGMSPDQVLAILGPSQDGLPANAKRGSEQFVRDGQQVEIYYARSGRVADGRLTDDEFTPYVFVNQKLVAIGWTGIGGAQTHGEVPPPPPQTNVFVTTPPPVVVH